MIQKLEWDDLSNHSAPQRQIGCICLVDSFIPLLMYQYIYIYIYIFVQVEPK